MKKVTPFNGVTLNFLIMISQEEYNELVSNAPTSITKNSNLEYYQGKYYSQEDHIKLLEFEWKVLKSTARFDCYFSLINPSDSQREDALSSGWVGNLELKDKAVGCYTKNQGGGINLIKIYTTLDIAKSEGNQVTVTVVKGNKEVSGKYWSTLTYIENLYPEESQLYWELNPQGREIFRVQKTQIPKSTTPLTGVVCYTKDHKIMRIYGSLASVETDRFSKKDVIKAITKGSMYRGYLWMNLTDWKDQDRLKAYHDLPNLPDLKDSLLEDEIKIVKCRPTGEVEYIYPSVQDVQGVSSKSLSSVLKKPIDNRTYKGFNWYKIPEYLQVFPGNIGYIKSAFEVPDKDSRKELHILLTISSKLISVNELYKARVAYAGGRPYPILYKNPKAQKVSDEVRNQLLALDMSDYISWLNQTTKYSISINFILKTGITRRDCANFEKIMCDDLTKFIKNDLGVTHFDDSEFYECNFVKSICPNANNEYAYIILKESFFEDRIDKFEKPERIYLGGPLDGYDWRSDFIKQLEVDSSSAFTCFDPRTVFLDPNLQKIERFQECNTELFVFTPGNLTEKTVLSIVERINSQTNVFIYMSTLGDLRDFSEDELRRLEFLEKYSLDKNKVYLKSDVTVSINDIYNWIKE